MTRADTDAVRADAPFLDMHRPNATPGVIVRPVVVGAVVRLCAELERYGVAGQVREGYGVALVSVGAGLVVWVEFGPEGLWYRWWTGLVSARTGRYLYTGCPAHAAETAARQVAQRYRDLRTGRPPQPAIAAGQPMARRVPPNASGGER